jgi:hypothetical protein
MLNKSCKKAEDKSVFVLAVTIVHRNMEDRWNLSHIFLDILKEAVDHGDYHVRT